MRQLKRLGRTLIAADKLARDLKQKSRNHRDQGHGGDDGVKLRIPFAVLWNAWWAKVPKHLDGKNGMELLAIETQEVLVEKFNLPYAKVECRRGHISVSGLARNNLRIDRQLEAVNPA